MVMAGGASVERGAGTADERGWTRIQPEAEGSEATRQQGDEATMETGLGTARL
jgi:hypothetical protein